MATPALTLPAVIGLLAAAVLILAVVITLTGLATLKERLRARAKDIVRLTDELELAKSERDIQAHAAAEHRELVSSLNASLDHERRQFDEKLALIHESKAQMTSAFRNLANDIMEEKSRTFTATNKENMRTVLSPLQEKITTFEKKIADSYSNEARERFSLVREIKSLQELNAKLSEDANNLASALKGDNKTQGSWGEVILESILGKSGLRKGREYEVQLSTIGANGTRNQPDVVVRLPERRDMIIDAKVSLKAYEAYCSNEDAEAKSTFLKQHIKSVRNHVKILAAKEYQSIPALNALDFVLLFLPIEAAYSLAAEHDEHLFLDAFQRNVIIVSPSTLLTTLRTVQNLWRLARQEKNAKEIADQAGGLYDKFVAFVEDLEEIGTRLDNAKISYQNVHNKLHMGRGNLVGRVEKLKQLGARTNKKMRHPPAQEQKLEGDSSPGNTDAADPR